MRFSKTNFVRNWITENCDICFITETHMTKGEHFMLELFTSFHNEYSEPSCEHPRGGISCFIKTSFMNNVTSVNTDIENFIVITVAGNHTVFGAYIAPKDSL